MNMRPVTQLIDEFIEDFFDGSIITILVRDIKRDGTEPLPLLFQASKSKSKDTIISVNKLENFLEKFIQIDIPTYLSLQDKAKEAKAPSMLQKIVVLRAYGLIINNPNNIKELEFYKIRSNALENELRKREEDIIGYLKTISAYKASSSATR